MPVSWVYYFLQMNFQGQNHVIWCIKAAPLQHSCLFPIVAYSVWVSGCTCMFWVPARIIFCLHYFWQKTIIKTRHITLWYKVCMHKIRPAKKSGSQQWFWVTFLDSNEGHAYLIIYYREQYTIYSDYLKNLKLCGTVPGYIYLHMHKLYIMW